MGLEQEPELSSLFLQKEMGLFINGTQYVLLSKTQCFDEVLITFSTWDRKRKLLCNGSRGNRAFWLGFFVCFFTKNIKGDKYTDKEKYLDNVYRYNYSAYFKAVPPKGM